MSASRTTYAVLLAGDHEELGQAEIAMLESRETGEEPLVFRGSRIRTTSSEQAARESVQALTWGEYWTAAEATTEGIRILARAVRHRTTGKGSAAVKVTRFGSGPKGLHEDTARSIGQALVDAGHAIDLKTPDVPIFAWIGEDRIHVGLLRGSRDDRHQERVMEKRSHFSPIGMHPRRAATLVHLTGAPTGSRILDPFCGTGGIVLEAAVEGYDAWGSDIDPWMVQGTYQTLTDAAEAPLDATVFQADIGEVPDLVEGVHAIVTDLPYGGASSTHDESLESLYGRAFEAFARILPAGAHAVVGHAEPRLLEGAEAHGLEVRKATRSTVPMVFADYVHKSLTRYYAVLRRR